MNSPRYDRVAALALAAALLLPAAFAARTALGQSFDAAWYDPSAAYVKIGVAQDGAYRILAADLAGAGVAISTIDPSTLRLLENGSEVPLRVSAAGAFLASGDAIEFVGRRNTGTDETWAYNEDASAMPSTYNSLYTDTTTYWLTWGTTSGIRYEDILPATDGAPIQNTTRANLHLETDVFYYPGQGSSAGNPIYTRAEGYYQERIRHNTSQADIIRNFDFDLQDASTLSTDSVVVAVSIVAETVSRHKIVLELSLDGGSGTSVVPVDSIEWVGISGVLVTGRVAQDQLPVDGNLQVRVRSRNNYNSATPNNLLLDYVDVLYKRDIRPIEGQIPLLTEMGPHLYTALLGSNARAFRPLTRETFALAPVSGSASFVAVAGTPDVVTIVEDGAAHAPASIELDASSSLAEPPGGGADYVIVTTASLRTTADALATYRSSPEGGAHTAMVVDVQDIFDQFDYGRPTPVAIRRFARAAQSWSAPIEFLTLWGDALYPNKSRARQPWEVPSFGHTASDGWFAMQQAGLSDYSEALAIGRLPIRSNEHGTIFVNKVRDYEAAPLDLWQKNAVFLAGGTTDSERQRLRQSARRWSSLVSGEPATLDTVHFFKQSANVLDPTFKDSIQQTLRRGASWLTYFGHSATQTWEIVTDPPALFDNAERLPVVLSLGCFTGDFGTGTGDPTDLRSFSEQLVIETPNGSIAHWGASSSGTIGASERFSDEVHVSVFTDSLRVLGQVFQAAKERYNGLYSDPISVKHLLQYGLIGDPATRISLPSDADLRIRPEDIRITPFAPVPSDDELVTNIAVRNIGLYPTDSTDVELTHILPDGSEYVYATRIPPFRNHLGIELRVPIDERSVGQNTIRVALDAGSALPELDVLNNTAQQALTVFSSGLAIAEPVNYALFPDTNVKLVVNTSSATVQDPSVIFEIDTVRTYDSGALMTFETPSNELTATWEPQGLSDEQIYYWRARINAPGQEDVWNSRTFTIRSSLGASGWYQANEHLADDAVSPSLAQWDAGWDMNTFTIDASASSEIGSGVEKGRFVVNGQFYENLQLGFGLLLIDGKTAILKASTAGATYVNDFDNPATVVAELKAVAAMAEPGDYVMTRTRHLGNYTGEVVIPDSIKAIFRDLGSQEIDNITYQDLWIMLGKIGAPEETREYVVRPPEGIFEIVERFSPEFRFGEATVTSPTIGPVAAWDEVVVDGSTLGAGTIVVDVLDASGSNVLQGGVSVPSTTPLTVNARLNPFVRIRATLSDSTRQSTPQLTNWRVSFSPVAELAIDPAGLALSADSVVVGTPLTASVAIRNLSTTVADSVIVYYEVIDAENRSTIVGSDTLFALADAGASTFEFGTDAFVGENRMRIDVRQPGRTEPISVNNVAILPFVVSGDVTAPDFAVFVDGESFPDDPDPVVNLQDPSLPFVSAQPQIEITVDDDLRFADFDADSAVVVVHLDDDRIATDQLAAVLSEDRRRLTVTFEPDLSARDSTHTLQVTVRDARGNAAAGSPYQTHFRVQNALEVEATYPYPNPMSNATRFAFRLRGADALLVREMVLRIYTVAGRLVRQFDLVDEPQLLEAGALKIGWNKLLWDGRDADGDEVATGVYLYRVYARGEGAAIGSGEVEKIAVIR